jgi:cytosine/adenosine deaminase-related metal-dependent hydrolase
MSQEKCVKMITLNNAKILGIDDILGTLETGKHATFIVTTGDVLDMRFSKVEHAFIKGGEVDLVTNRKGALRKYQLNTDLIDWEGFGPFFTINFFTLYSQ